MRGGGQSFPPMGRGGGPGMGGRGGMGGFPGAGRGMPPQMGQMPGQPNSSGIDLDQLQSVPAPQQKQMLGEALYPKIHEQQPELAGKITGMLLEMDNAELLNLTNDDNALRNKVNEALSVYDEYMRNADKEGGEKGGADGVPNENHKPNGDAEQKA